MFYILFFMSYISASVEVSQACVVLYDHLMEVSGHFNNVRSITVHSPVTMDSIHSYTMDSIHSYPGEVIPMANQIKGLLCTRFFNVNASKLPERIEACMEALNLNLEFMISHDTASSAANVLIQDARMFLNSKTGHI